MSRECSIPASLKNSVVSRWLNGHSPQSIVAWIYEGNDSRTVPVETSRSSIERLIEHYATTEDLPRVLPAVRRCQRNAQRYLDNLDAVADEIWKCVDEADKPDGLPVSRLNVKLRGIAQVEKIYMRHLKLAGIDGKPADLDSLDGDTRSRVRGYDSFLRRELENENVLFKAEPAAANSEPEQTVNSARIDERIPEKTSVNVSSIPVVKAARQLAEAPGPVVTENERIIKASIDAIQARIDQLHGEKGGAKKGAG